MIPVSWLAIIFASFSLFADNNATTIVALGIFALSVSASIFLILELSQPFTGLMMISSEPLRSALAPLNPCKTAGLGSSTAHRREHREAAGEVDYIKQSAQSSECIATSR